jgi:hypothetical protein
MREGRGEKNSAHFAVSFLTAEVAKKKTLRTLRKTLCPLRFLKINREEREEGAKDTKEKIFAHFAVSLLTAKDTKKKTLRTLRFLF